MARPIWFIISLLFFGANETADGSDDPDGPKNESTIGAAPDSDQWQQGRVRLVVELGHSSRVTSVAFSPAGRQVLTGSWDKIARLWDATTGQELRRFEGHGDAVDSATFSPDGRRVLTGSWDKTARLWDATTGQELRRFEGHIHWVTSVAFSPDGRQVLTGSGDNTVRLWDAATGKELCQLVSFSDDTWAVMDRDGRFDASNGGDVEGLHWVVGNEPIALSQLKERYYEPGLLAKVMGFNKEPLRDVSEVKDVKLFPEVQLTAPTGESPRLGVHLVNQGGGIGRVVVLVNNQELTADARGPKPQPAAKQLDLQINLAHDPRFVPGPENVIEVQAYNAEGYLRSRGLKLLYDPGLEAQAAKPDVWAIVAGVSDYRGDAIDLRYAAKDAVDFAKALQLSAGRLFGADRVHLAVLTGSQTETAQTASRQNLLSAFSAAQQAMSTDILIIYLAGHGVNYGGQDGDFYYLTSDAHTADLTDPELRRQIVVSSDELTAWIGLIHAGKKVLILDTCAAGRAVEKLTDKRAVPSSQTRALDRVKDRTGMFVLAGCAADRVSYETSRYGQGLLTYSLLLGMRGAALREEQFVDVSQLFHFATDRVEVLAKDIGGLQRPVPFSPKGAASFDIGQLLSEDKSQIPLQAVLPMVLRASFQDEDRLRDQLNLSKQVNERLRDAAARGRQAPLVFVEAEEFPGACELAGRYRVRDGAVTVTVVVSQDNAERTRFEVSGRADGVADLATELVRQAESRLRTAELRPSSDGPPTPEGMRIKRAAFEQAGQVASIGRLVAAMTVLGRG